MTFRVYNEPPSVPDREAVDDITITKTDAFLVDYCHPKLKSALYYADVEGYLTPEQDGDYEIGLSVFGAGKLYANGELVIDNETEQKQGTLFFGSGTVEERGIVKMEKGKVYHIKLEFKSAPASKLSNDAVVAEAGGAFRIGGTWVIDPEKEIKHAVTLAKEADQVIICAGLNVREFPASFLAPFNLHLSFTVVILTTLQSDWETEGLDRETMDLPGRMDDLITSVAAANPSTVVIMQSGTPVSMPWISSVASLIQAWYGGNETGNGIADVLFGDVNPSGKLPLTFPKRVQDNPAFLNYRSERGRTLYGEDVYVGYKFYETADREVLFPFGHGLSYTEFSMAGLEVQQVGEIGEEELLVKVALKNTGSVAGSQVAQVYISQLEPSIRRPMKELRGFNKVFLEAGESKEVEVKIALKYATSFWDEARDAWIMEKGRYKVILSDSSELVEGKFLETGFELLKTRWWNGL
jgi:beta-glucosidase